jgi:hypothetical protein
LNDCPAAQQGGETGRLVAAPVCRNVAGSVIAPLIVAALMNWNDAMDVIHTVEGEANPQW